MAVTLCACQIAGARLNRPQIRWFDRIFCGEPLHRRTMRFMTSLLDQSTLTDLAESLVAAARKAGADAADAVAVRSVSAGVEVRDGAVEESERSESDDLGLRVFVGRKQAVVSTNDIAGAERRDARRARRRDGARRAGRSLCRPRRCRASVAHNFPISIWSIRTFPRSRIWKSSRARPKQAGLAVKGVTKSGGASASAGIGGMVLVTSHGFSGAYLGSRHSALDDGDRRRRHRHGARLRILLQDARGRSRCAASRSARSRASARSSASIRARSRRAKCR